MTRLGKGFEVTKGGKVKRRPYKQSVSQRIAAKNKTRVVKGKRLK